MSSKNKKNQNKKTKTDAKKAAVLGETTRKFKPVVFILVALAFAGGGIATYLSLVEPARVSATATTVSSPAAGTTEVAYPVSLFDDGKAHHFEHQNGNITIRYFILKSSDGIIRAAFDACDVCWPAGKGYYQEGDQMVCRNCGRRFASKMINEVKGGCNPAPLTRTMEGDRLVIRVNDILTGNSYFDLT